MDLTSPRLATLNRLYQGAIAARACGFVPRLPKPLPAERRRVKEGQICHGFFLNADWRKAASRKAACDAAGWEGSRDLKSGLTNNSYWRSLNLRPRGIRHGDQCRPGNES